MKFNTKSWTIPAYSFTRSYNPVSSRMMYSHGDYAKCRNILTYEYLIKRSAESFFVATHLQRW